MTEKSERAHAVRILIAYNQWRKQQPVGEYTKRESMRLAYRAGYAQAEADAQAREQEKE